MSKKYNPLTLQVLDLVNLVDVQIDNIKESLEKCINNEDLSRFSRIYITGSGDSFFAAKAALKAFDKFGHAFGSRFFAITPIDLARYEKYAGNTPNENILVIGISASGGPARVYEALKRAKEIGYSTMAITNNPESRVASTSDYILHVNTPPGDNSPGLRSYFASQLALFMLAAKYGKARGITDLEAELEENVRKYVHAYDDVLVPVRDQIDAISDKLYTAKAFNFIGDDLNYQTAYFGAATMIEVSGHMCTIDDSESWCHVNHFTKNPEAIPVVVNADVNSNSISRVMETLTQADIMNHPTVLVINDKNHNLTIPKNTDVVVLPQNIEGYDFISNLMNHSVVSILSALVAEKTNEPYFRGDDLDKSKMTIQNSEIVLIGRENV